MSISFSAIKAWLWSFIPKTAKGRRDLALDLLEIVFGLSPVAIPIVASIEHTLKPELNTSSSPATDTIERFLGQGLDGPELTEARKEAQRIAYFPRAELYTCAALFLLNRHSVSIPERLLRLVIVYAYAEFIGAKSEAEVSGSD